MLKRIKLIQGIGSFNQTRASSIELSSVTVIYGENRYGKSTLCDVFYSLAEDSPVPILSRQRIPNDSTKPPKVDLQFKTATGNHVSKFENNEWRVKSPECSNLYVFDHSFIHRNVLTGTKPERPNSESMTRFILGESNTALFENLAVTNKNLREKRRLLSDLEGQIRAHPIGGLHDFVNSVFPTQSKPKLDIQLAQQETTKQQTIALVQNINIIKGRNNLTNIANQTDFNDKYNSINTTLESSLENVHQNSLVILQNHMTNHVVDPASFKGWANQGVAQITNDCPFCGQVFSTEAQGIISAYQQTFNSQFDNHNNQIKQILNSLRQPFIIPNDRISIGNYHRSNIQTFQSYIEPQITSNLSLNTLLTSLEVKFTSLLSAYDSLERSIGQVTTVWTLKFEQKHLTPYEPATHINFDNLRGCEGIYNQSILEYWQIVEQINTIFSTYKSSLDETQLTSQVDEITRRQSETSFSLKRIELEPKCNQYNQMMSDISNLEGRYNIQKKMLEQSQTSYLDTYFDCINQLFQQLGSSDFEIIKTANNRGAQVVYDLSVKFKGESIPANNINTIFSESDRRALALCIFLARIMSLPEDEKAKAILILDDPVTSFDNERITLILNKLDELQRTTKQLILTTHYKNMAIKASKKFRRVATTIKLNLKANTCSFESVNINDMMATEHDLAFERIKSFANNETNEDILTSLRPFFEQEIRNRYKKQLQELGTSNSDLSVCTESLREHSFISTKLEARLSTIRDSLNTAMHEIGNDALENTRALARDILDVVYNGLNTSL